MALTIFDCDGVLIDSEPLSIRVEATCLADLGMAVTETEIAERYVGLSMAAMLADLEARFGRPLPEDFAETLRRRTAAAFEASLEVMPGVRDMLDAVGGRICVASSSAPDRLRLSLRVVGLLARFEPNVFSATEVARGKPAPDLFLFAADRMHVAPTRCVVIEDSVPGITAARAAGMTAIGFCGGGHCRPGHAGRLQAAGARAVFARMDELAEFLRLQTSLSGARC
jgi:HAD superfamily hydrolase (TIGR01509 family)